MPLGHLLLRSARRDPDREALVFPDERWTYRELTDQAWGIAKSLLALGVQPGDHVGFLMTNHPDLVATFFGISLAGAVVVPINARYRTTELATIAEDADLVVLLTHDAADAHVDFTALIARRVRRRRAGDAAPRRDAGRARAGGDDLAARLRRASASRSTSAR